MVSAGFDAELVHWIAQRRRGPMRRIDWLVAVLACRRAAEPVFEVALDDGPRAPARYVAVYNCGLYAGGFRACPAARVDDGWFHVLTLREPIVPRFARVAWTILRGRAESLPDATLKAARRVRISGAARSQIDGDPGPAGDLDLAIEPAAVLLRGAPAGPARSAAEEDVLA
jgi:diacylglycerol kinase family enzyme